MSAHEPTTRRPLRRPARHAATLGLFLVLAGCTASGGGCSPLGQPGSTTTTGPTTSESTTTIADSTTSTTSDPSGSTTTTEDPSGSTTTVPGSSTTTVPSTTIPPGGGDPVDVASLEVGACMTPTDADSFVSQVVLLDCEGPHGSEVFAQYELESDAGHPGGSELTWAAQDRCQDEFEGYVGESYWDSAYDLTTITPSFSTWDQGDRTVTCLLIDPQGQPLTGAAKDSGR